MKTETNSLAVDLKPLVRPLTECERVSMAVIDAENYNTVTVRQNTEVGDHWLMELNLERWRSAEELARYLRTAANIIIAAEAKALLERKV